MKLRNIAILSLAFLLPLSLSAQKKRKRVRRKPVVEVPQEDPRITNMREMTQQILIIDSIVTDKDQFLSELRLSGDNGSLMKTRDFIGKESSGYAFVNEMGNKAYFSLPDDSLRQQLFTSDLLGDSWSNAQPLKGLSEGIIEASYPYMLTDGITFYFAGKGEESIGGYDIFLTRYDSHSGSFLKPENIGMPFNSEANDYMYAIDEYNRIGYFVSDRRQPEGKVCIYIFEPAESRQTYDTSAYSEQQMRDLAGITSIADTWGNGAARNTALARWKAIGSQKKNTTKEIDKTTMLVINDNHTYTSANDFKSKEAATYYQQLVKARRQLAEENHQTEQLRKLYQQASSADKQSLKTEILNAEDHLLQLNQQIKALEKQACNAENKIIN